MSKIRSRAILRAITFAFLCPIFSMAQKADEAREIIRAVIDKESAQDEVVDILMRLTDSAGKQRQRTATLYAKKKTESEDMRLFRFHTPADLAKSGVLTIEHDDRDADQWMYLPAYHASRRVASSNRRDNWMGTDFSYEDIIDQKTGQYEYRTISKERLR